jgi:hypothetical protein
MWCIVYCYMYYRINEEEIEFQFFLKVPRDDGVVVRVTHGPTRPTLVNSGTYSLTPSEQAAKPSLHLKHTSSEPVFKMAEGMFYVSERRQMK